MNDSIVVYSLYTSTNTIWCSTIWYNTIWYNTLLKYVTIPFNIIQSGVILPYAIPFVTIPSGAIPGNAISSGIIPPGTKIILKYTHDWSKVIIPKLEKTICLHTQSGSPQINNLWRLTDIPHGMTLTIFMFQVNVINLHFQNILVSLFQFQVEIRYEDVSLHV